MKPLSRKEIIDYNIDKNEVDEAIWLLNEEIRKRRIELCKNGFILIQDSIKQLNKLDEENIVKAFDRFYKESGFGIFIDEDEETFDIIHVDLNVGILFPKEVKFNLDQGYGYYIQHCFPIYRQGKEMRRKVNEGQLLHFKEDGSFEGWDPFFRGYYVYKAYEVEDSWFKLKRIVLEESCLSSIKKMMGL